MLRLGYKLVIAPIAAIPVEIVVFLYVREGLISSSIFGPFSLLMIPVFVMVINVIQMLDSRGRAKTK